MQKIKLVVVSFVLLAWSVNSHAVSSQQEGAAQFDAAQLVSFAKQVEKTLAAKGARVFLLSRVGRPRSELPKGFNYTHTGIGVYSVIKTGDGQQIPGYTIYNLYQKDEAPNTSHLVQDFPVDFYNGVYELKSGIVIPTPDLQRRLLEVIGSGVDRKLHNPAYSAISNPNNSQYQNCTEYVLDVINAAIYRTDDVTAIKANNAAYFRPQPVNVNPFKLLFGSLFSADITMVDHDENVATATFTTIANYLEKYGMVQERFEISAQ